jgi:signal peptidase I
LTTENKEQPDKPKKLKSGPKEYFDALLFAALVAVFLKLFFIEAYRIPTGSMMNTLLVGDFLLVNKFVYGATTPRNIPFTDIRIPYFRLPALKHPTKGDVVVFDFPGYRDEVQPDEVISYIKRLGAEPGDTITIKDKILYINNIQSQVPPEAIIQGKPQNTNITDPRIFPKGSGWNEDNYGPLRIPARNDTIKLSQDNFDMWKSFIEKEGHKPRLTADGKIFIDEKPANFYITERDYYFMIGDNRSNSLDSRFWGFLPAENVIGEALIIYWSWDPGIPFTEIGKLFGSIRWNRIAKIIN